MIGAVLVGCFLAWVLISAGLQHLSDIAELEDILRDHQVVPDGAVRVTARFVTTLELVIGSGTLVATATGVGVRVALALGFAMLVAFALYLGLAARRSRPDVSCGCGPFDLPLTRWSWTRPAGLAALAMIGYVVSQPAPAWAIACSVVIGLLAAIALDVWTTSASWLRAAANDYRLLTDEIT